jgi:alkanesulfonate monooxygenase SsuD/methylene tetrahydromethanopterin reductase-like flavin-dependent oxidoreductase (luciferase family)
MPRVRFGIDIAQQRLEWDELVRRARFGEELGFDGAWGFDHFKPLYGEGPGNCFEGMTTLAALAMATNRIRLGLLVTGVTYRHPSVLAAEAITIDHASGGRLELALGAAWFEDEHRELGIPFPPVGERIDRLEDTVEAVRQLCNGEDITWSGRTLTLEHARLRPLPVQRPHPPIWIGASGERRMLPLAGRVADAWHCFGDASTLERKWEIVATAAAEAGRDPVSILRAGSLSLSGDLNGVARELEAHERAGTAYLVCGWPGEGHRRVEEFVTHLMPPAG